MNAEVNILDYSNPQAILIPESIVSEDSENRKFVFVVKNNTAVKVIIKTGYTQNGFIEVTEGLQLNQVVINEGGRIVKDDTFYYAPLNYYGSDIATVGERLMFSGLPISGISYRQRGHLATPSNTSGGGIHGVSFAKTSCYMKNYSLICICYCVCCYGEYSIGIVICSA